jgi:glycosyltransferase involved in cell wall biosynthesis
MRIAIDARDLARNITGVGRYLTNLIRNWVAESDKNQFLLYSDQPVQFNFQTQHITEKILQGHPILWKQILLPLTKIMHDHDLIFSPSYSAPLFTIEKTVVTIHDLVAVLKPEWTSKSQHLRFKTIVNLSAKCSTKIIAVSETTRNDIIEITGIPSNKIAVVYEGVDEMFKVIGSQDGISIPGSDKPFILFVGSIHPRRNIKRLIQAFNAMKNNGQLKHKLVLVGMVLQESRALSEWINTSRWKKDIICLNYVTDENLVRLYNTAELFVYPSLYEGFGLPVLEAMACGTPVITSNVSSLPEVAGSAAILVDPYSVEDIIKAIKNIVQDKELKNDLIERGLERSKVFSWGKASKETLEIFENLK